MSFPNDHLGLSGLPCPLELYVVLSCGPTRCEMCEEKDEPQSGMILDVEER
jgi:hypothetical protein